MLLRIAICAALTLTAAGQVLSQENIQPAVGNPAANVTAEDFPKLFEAWENNLKAMDALRKEYPEAPPEKQAELEKQYAELVGQMQQMQPKFMASMEAAARADLNKYPKAGQLLSQMAIDALEYGNAAEASRIAELLLSLGYKGEEAPVVAGVAAFDLNENKKALAYLTQAKQDGKLPKLAEGPLAEAKIRLQEQQADDLPRVVLETSEGKIVLELFENEAPNTVANFVELIEKGFYDGLNFHRVLDGFMAQGGCPEGDGTGGPGYNIKCECTAENHRNHFRGSLSMAKAAAPNTGGSQFFINYQPTPHLDGKHTVFGRVLEGMAVVDQLQRIDPSNPDPRVEPSKILKATVVRKRNHPYKAEKLPDTRG